MAAAWLELLCCVVRLIPSYAFADQRSGLVNGTAYRTETLVCLSMGQILNVSLLTLGGVGSLSVEAKHRESEVVLRGAL
jgi:hypothetical protein